MVTVDISIVALNQLHDLRALLPVLMRGYDPHRGKIMVLDNRSTDGTREYVTEMFPQIEYSYNGDVTGYGGNHNRNICRADAEFCVVMNADIVVDYGTVVALAERLHEHPSVVVGTGRIVDPNGNVQGLVKRYPTVLDLISRILGLDRWSGHCRRRNALYETRDLGYENDRDAELVSGAFMMMRTATLRAIGGFDECFFLYFEDFDLCMRMQKHGRIRYFSEFEIVHGWHRDAHRSFRHMRWFIASAARFFQRHGLRLVSSR